MSDIFREVDEDIRRDQMKNIWDRFGPYVIGAAVLIVLATAGFRGWEYWQQRQANTSGDRFIEAVEAAETGDHARAVELLEALAADGSGSYPILAGFRIATEKAALGDTSGAIAEYEAIAGSSAPDEVRNIARLRAALMEVDSLSLAEMEESIEDLAATGNPWRHTAREILGLTAWRTGEYTQARTYFDDILADQEAPNEIAQRARVMMDLITARIGLAPETSGS